MEYIFTNACNKEKKKKKNQFKAKFYIMGLSILTSTIWFGERMLGYEKQTYRIS
jgi:hypothetical protein